MISPRKLFWPSALALGFLLFFVSAPGPRFTVEAAPANSEICRIEGPDTMLAGDTALFAWRVQDNAEDIVDITGLIDDHYSVSIDNMGGASGRIVAVSKEEEPNPPPDDTLEANEFVSVGPTNFVGHADVTGPNEIEMELYEFFAVRYGYYIEANPCGDRMTDVSAACIVSTVPNVCDLWDDSSASERAAWAEAMESAMAGGVVDCLELMFIGEEAFLDAGGLLSEVRGVDLDADEDLDGGIDGYWLAVCDFTTPDLIGPILDDVGFVAVTCFEPGVFTLSVADEEHTGPDLQHTTVDAMSLEITCLGSPAAATMTALPTPIEIIPSLGNVAHTLVTVEIEDVNEVPLDGINVIFSTDRCAIESSAVDTNDEYDSALAVFKAYTALVPQTALDVENHVAATTGPDGGSPQQEEVVSLQGIAATVLHCDPIHALGATPGPAKITAIVEKPGDDFVLNLVVNVVGPPAPNGLSAIGTPATLICGEKATIDVTVKDAIGQAVSDHTFVEAVTNYGGVLAGTGAVAGQAGPVVPLSSTIAETFGGKATFYLLTSDTHVGKYEVVITTGGGAGVTGSNQLGTGGLLGGLVVSSPITIQLSFDCTEGVPGQPAAAAPASGALKPPSTGDAGIAGSSAPAAVVWFAGGALALLASACFTLRRARD